MGTLPEQPITEAVHAAPYPHAANVVVAYPSFGDWVRLYDAQKNRTMSGNHELFVDMRRNHERKTLEQLNIMVKSDTGQAVFDEISARPSFSVMILPFDFLPAGSWSQHAGAITRAVQSQAESLVGVPMAGQTSTGKRYFSPTKGAGTGSAADIYFTSRRHRGHETPDEVLLHELTHATRKLRGVVHRMPVSGGYGNLEEFLATLVANIYRSEKGKPPLDYHGQDIDPAKFLDTELSPTPRLLIATFRGKQPDFFAALSAIEAKFNPVHQVDVEAGAAMKRAANG
jgi:hypothetical protein